MKGEKDLLKAQVERLVRESDGLHAKIRDEISLNNESLRNMEQGFEDERRSLLARLKDAISERDSSYVAQDDLHKKFTSVSQINQDLENTIQILKVSAVSCKHLH